MQFSEEELQVIQNQSFFKVKATATEKIAQQFAKIADELTTIYQQFAPNIAYSPAQLQSKISKGENLQQLPFLILDFPRYFTTEKVFSFRLLFWWGKGFTLFLHLKNKELPSILEKIQTLSPTVELEDTFFSFNGDEWNHDIESENYHNLTVLKTIQHIDFIKFAWHLPLKQHSELESFITNKTTQILEILSNHE